MARSFVLNFGLGETTGIQEATGAQVQEYKDGGWYTLEDVRLSCKPTKRGIYIVNGKKIIVK